MTVLEAESPLDRLLPLMRSKGVRISAAQFHSVVNTTFHSFEADVYDDVHRGMWGSLMPQFELLSSDALRNGRDIPASLIAVDVGCGTGLSAEFLLRTHLGARVSKLYLVDTSPAMLRRAAGRAAGWRVPVECVEGTLQDLTLDRCDLIVMCSVLHHVPDLAGCFASVARVQAPGGLLMHLQDPNRDYRRDPEFDARCQELRSATIAPPITGLRRVTPARIARRLKRQFLTRAADDYIAKANRALLEGGIIERAMTADEMWQVTDLHVPSGGVSIREMKQALAAYEALSIRSYGFFGELSSDLPSAFRGAEEALIAARSLNGREVAGIWQKRW